MAAKTDQTLSDLVKQAVHQAITEDADDLAAIEARRSEPTCSFESFAGSLKRRG